MPPLRYALRTLVKSPGPSLIVTVTLAIAIGATTIIASTIDGVWHAIPAADTERLVFVASTDPRPSQAQSGMSGNLAMTGTSVPDLVDWTAQSTTVEQFGAFRYGTATLTGREAPARVSLVRTTAEMFSLWGIAPSLGRVFRADDGRIGAAPVVLLSHRYWQDEFASDPSVIERSVLLDGVAHSIVGVVPPIDPNGDLRRHRSVRRHCRSTPHGTRATNGGCSSPRDSHPGVTRAQAEADLAGIANRLKTQYPNTNAQTGVVVRPLIEQLGGQIQTLLFLLALIAALVAAMACANVSNVVLAQAIGRQHELSVRTALGAQRRDHLKQLAAESLLISLAAGVAGLVLGGWGLALLKWLAGPQARLFGDAALNWRIVAAGIATAFVLPLGFAFIPALQSWRPNPADLKDGARTLGGGSAHRIRRVLVAVQVGLAVVLLVQISLFARTAWNFRTMESGFNPQGVLTFRMDLPAAKYTRERTTQFYRDVADAHRRVCPASCLAGTINRLAGSRSGTERAHQDRQRRARSRGRASVHRARDGQSVATSRRCASRCVRGRGFSDADFVRSGSARCGRERRSRAPLLART